MRKILDYINDNLMACLLGVLLTGMAGTWIWRHATDYQHDRVYYDRDFRIASCQGSTAWRNGKFSGVDKRWLLQDLRDTSLYAEWPVESDQAFFTFGAGDTVHFDYIRKNRFFRVIDKRLYRKGVDAAAWTPVDTVTRQKHLISTRDTTCQPPKDWNGKIDAGPWGYDNTLQETIK